MLYAKIVVRNEIEGLKQEIEKIEQKNKELASLIELFKDPDIIELEAKRRLNLKKHGEEVVVILRDKNDESQNIVHKREVVVEDDIEISDKEPPNPLKWWAYITSDKN